MSMGRERWTWARWSLPTSCAHRTAGHGPCVEYAYKKRAGHLLTKAPARFVSIYLLSHQSLGCKSERPLPFLGKFDGASLLFRSRSVAVLPGFAKPRSVRGFFLLIGLAHVGADRVVAGLVRLAGNIGTAGLLRLGRNRWVRRLLRLRRGGLGVRRLGRLRRDIGRSGLLRLRGSCNVVRLDGGDILYLRQLCLVAVLRGPCLEGRKVGDGVALAVQAEVCQDFGHYAAR